MATIKDASDLIANTTQQTIDSYVKYVFGASDFGNAALAQAMQGGFFLDLPSSDKSLYDLSGIYASTATAKLIELAWGLGDVQYPTVLYYAPNVDNPSSQGFPLSDDDAATCRFNGTFSGVDGQDYSLFLVNAKLPPGMCPPAKTCVTQTPFGFNPLMGQSAIDYEGNQWGVVWQDLATSAFNGYALNNRANPYPFNGTTSGGSTVQNTFLYSEGIATPGFASFPVCHFNLAIENFIHLDDTTMAPTAADPSSICDYWPCCPITWTLDSGSPCEGKNSVCE